MALNWGALGFLLMCCSQCCCALRANEPDWLPPAQKIAPMVRSPDGKHFFLQLELGEPGQPLGNIVLDTASPHTMVFPDEYCKEKAPPPRPDQDPTANMRSCYRMGESSTAAPPGGAPTDEFYRTVFDQEYVRTGAVRKISDRFRMLVCAPGLVPPVRDISDVTDEATLLSYRTACSRLMNTSSFLVASELFIAPSGHTNSANLLHNFNYVAGVIGSSYLRDGQPSSAWLSLLAPLCEQPNQLLFSLDLRLNYQENSVIYLGGVPEPARDVLQWSRAPGDIPPSLPLPAGENDTHHPGAVELRELAAFHSLFLYDVSVCDTALLSDTTPQEAELGFAAVIDSAATCLTLPMEMFDALIKHVPLWCGVDTHMTPLSVQQCSQTLSSTVYYYSKNDPAKLPTLSFRLSPDGQLLYLPLESLLLAATIPPTSPGLGTTEGRPVCLVRGNSLSSGGKVYFGNMALAAFTVVLSMHTHQVGIANKVATEPSYVQCKPNLDCIGMQLHHSEHNVCLDPSCSNYYFFTLNEETKECVLSDAFHVLAACVITFLIATEMAVHEIYLRLQKKVLTTVERS